MLLTHFLPFWEVTTDQFIKFGRQYKVIVQAAPQYRALPEDILKLYVKNNRDEMVPFSAFMHLEKVYGLSKSRDTICTMLQKLVDKLVKAIVVVKLLVRLKEVADKTLPRGYGIDWAGISKDEEGRGKKQFIFS